MINPPVSMLSDIPTYDRIERAIRLHDVGRVFEKMGVISSEEHHYASLFVALQVDPDPVVCEAVLNHVSDVLSKRASIVSRHVRDIDRIAGSGYIGLIRTLSYYGFDHPAFHEKDEDKIVNEGIMVTFSAPHGKARESLAKEFFWKEVYPFFETQGVGGVELVGTLSKIILDRIFGRNYKGKSLNYYENKVLKLDHKVRIVEPVLDDYKAAFEFKVENTLEVLLKTRGARQGERLIATDYLSWTERESYEAYRFIGLVGV